MKDEIFEQCVKFVLDHEGGYVNHPDDPGGETNFGISKRAYPDLDIKNLTIEEAKEIYKRDYWDKIPLTHSGDYYSLGSAMIMFDTAVNMGIEISRKMCDESGCHFCRMYNWRLKQYNKIARKPKMLKFLRGWINRLTDLYDYVDDLGW